MIEINIKTCSKCKNIKTIGEFYKDSQKKDGATSQCKECKLVYAEAHREEARIRTSNYCKKNKEEISIKRSIYYKDNKESIIKYQIDYREKNREYISKRQLIYNQSVKGKASFKNTKHRRRSKLKQGDITTNQLAELEQNAKTCYWCKTTLKGKSVHIDHYIPLAKGGEHTISNLVVSCDKCNMRKHAKDPIVFANSIGRLL